MRTAVALTLVFVALPVIASAQGEGAKQKHLKTTPVFLSQLNSIRRRILEWGALPTSLCF